MIIHYSIASLEPPRWSRKYQLYLYVYFKQPTQIRMMTYATQKPSNIASDIFIYNLREKWLNHPNVTEHTHHGDIVVVSGHGH